MRQWGTGSQVKADKWGGGLWWKWDSGDKILFSIDMPSKGMAGTLPGQLANIEKINLAHNKLTGGIPNWIYSAPKLRILDIRNNDLSGTVTGSAFNTPNLEELLLMSNRFSGSVPNFNFTRLSKVIDLRLSNNLFAGPIPASWSGLADGRGMIRLQAKGINLTGNLPNWVSNLKFANTTVRPGEYDYYIDFSENKLCISSDFTVPTYKMLNGSNAPVLVNLNDNECPTGSSGPREITAPPGRDVEFTPVDSSGNPTQTNPVGLKVNWKKPRGITGSVTYTVRLHLTIPFQKNLNPEQTPTYLYCPDEQFQKSVTTAATDPETTVTSSDCSSSGNVKLPFDPTKYVVSVTSSNIIGNSVFSGRRPTTSVWSFYHTVDSSYTYTDVIGVLGLRHTSRLWHWDADNQVWQELNQAEIDFDSTNLEPGRVLTAPVAVPATWLPYAGLSTADTDTPVQLQNGWNVLSAGGYVQRGDDDGAFFIDNSLIDCDSLQGVIAVYRYSAATRRFDVELPCHPSREAALTRGNALRGIEELEELDSLYIYFRSALPVSIAWDECEDPNPRYVAASSARAETACPST